MTRVFQINAGDLMNSGSKYSLQRYLLGIDHSTKQDVTEEEYLPKPSVLNFARGETAVCVSVTYKTSVLWIRIHTDFNQDKNRKKLRIFMF
jgi:hypothetical protein